MKFVLSIKNIPYDWYKFVSHVKSLIIIILEMSVFKVMTINMW
jgi:hypothetical protein